MSNQLWSLLKKEDLVQGELPTVDEVNSPWFVKVLLAISGWLAAIFLLGSLGAIFSRFYSNTPVLTVLGIGLIILSYILLSRKKLGEFVEHLALAFSVAGQALLVVAIVNMVGFSSDSLFWMSVGVIQMILAFIMPNFVHRLVSAFIAATSFAAAIYNYQDLSSGLLIYSAFLMLVTALLWLNEFKSKARFETVHATAYGFVLALVAITGTKLFMNTSVWQMRRYKPENEWLSPWIGEALISAVAIYVVWKLLQKNQIKQLSTAWILALVGTLLLTFLSLEAHGLIVGVMIVLLGFSSGNRVLTGLGVISLLFYISSYYYLLESTLLSKSITLFLLGVALMLGRFIMLKLLPDSGLQTKAMGEAE